MSDEIVPASDKKIVWPENIREVKSADEPDLLDRPEPKTVNLVLLEQVKAAGMRIKARAAQSEHEIVAAIREKGIATRLRMPVLDEHGERVRKDPASRGERWDQDAKQALAAAKLIETRAAQGESIPTNASPLMLRLRSAKSKVLSKVLGKLTN